MANNLQYVFLLSSSSSSLLRVVNNLQHFFFVLLLVYLGWLLIYNMYFALLRICYKTSKFSAVLCLRISIVRSYFLAHRLRINLRHSRMHLLHKFYDSELKYREISWLLKLMPCHNWLLCLFYWGGGGDMPSVWRLRKRTAAMAFLLNQTKFLCSRILTSAVYFGTLNSKLKIQNSDFAASEFWPLGVSNKTVQKPWWLNHGYFAKQGFPFGPIYTTVRHLGMLTASLQPTHPPPSPPLSPSPLSSLSAQTLEWSNHDCRIDNWRVRPNHGTGTTEPSTENRFCW